MIIKNLKNINFDPDYTIIGSGPASLTLAMSLEEKGFSSIIFEAGGLVPTDENQSYYTGEVAGDHYFDLDVSRLRCFGGTSQHWSGWCRNLDESDFESWPIKKSDIDPYLNQACKILEISNNFESIKISENINQINFNFSPPVRFNVKYFEKIKNSKKIFLLMNAPLKKIIGNDNNVVESIDLYHEKNVVNFKVKNLIVGCGGIENSRILLWNKINSNNAFLKHINPGHYWFEHPHFNVGKFVGDFRKIKNLFNDNYSRGNEIFLSLNNNYVKKNKIRNNAIRLKYRQSKEFIDQTIYEIQCQGPGYAKKITDLLKKEYACFYDVKMVWEQIPNYESKITLSKNKKDNLNIPKVILNWKKIKDDSKTPLKCLENLGNYFIKKDIGRISIYDFIKNQNNIYPEDDAIGGNHHMGGTRIGTDYKNNDIVDKNLKVLGTKNLYMTGSSVFRTGGHANPTLTIVQLSLRLADFLKNNSI